MKTKSEEYIVKITELFLQYGIRSVSIQDIANKLGMSKKTVYQVFLDKEDIVKQSIEYIKLQMDKIVVEFNSSRLNVVEREIAMRKKYLNTYLKIKPTYVFDLKKFYPNIYDDFIAYKTKLISKTTKKFIDEGQKQGLLREGIDPEYMCKLSITLTFAIFHPDIDVFSDSDLTSENYSDQFFLYHMNGICSEKGRKLLNKLLDNDLLKEQE